MKEIGTPTINQLCYTFNIMEYKYAIERKDYTDLASGNVFYSLAGHPAFPVRLASEIYQRCLAWRGQGTSPCTIYDPCCGAAYHLSVIAYLHWDSVCRVICSDIDEKAVKMAARNMGLLKPEGMERRRREILAMVHLYNKESHRSALESIDRMQEHVRCMTAVRPIQTHVFRANATQAASLREGLKGIGVDVVFSDIPYGLHSEWEETQAPDPIQSVLEALFDFMSPTSIVAITSDKHKKIAHESYQRLEKFQLGKRQVVILRPT